jgi:hypothetical protein
VLLAAAATGSDGGVTVPGVGLLLVTPGTKGLLLLLLLVLLVLPVEVDRRCSCTPKLL